MIGIPDSLTPTRFLFISTPLPPYPPLVSVNFWKPPKLEEQNPPNLPILIAVYVWSPNPCAFRICMCEVQYYVVHICVSHVSSLDSHIVSSIVLMPGPNSQLHVCPTPIRVRPTFLVYPSRYPNLKWHRNGPRVANLEYGRIWRCSGCWVRQ